MLELILALILGIIAGTITGLLPGIHINLVSSLLVSSIGLFAGVPVLAIAVFIVAMSIAHTFLDFIPSIFLGAPDEDTTLSVLPGHELLLQGNGYQAVLLSLYGCLTGVFLVLILSPLFLIFLPKIFQYLNTIMFFVLIIANIYLIVKEKSSLWKGLFVFLLSGFLGLATLNLNVNNSLLPLLTGLFGSSSLITSILKKQKVPKQKISKLKISKKDFVTPGIGAVLSAPLCSFLPALGSGQAAVIGSDITGEKDRKKFLILLGMINAIVAGLSFVAVYAIQKARTGTAVAVQQLLENFSFYNLLVILAVVLISGIICFFLAILMARIFSKNIARINYSGMSFGILIFISSAVLIFSGFFGFAIFLVATSIGLVTIHLNVRRTHMLGSLMLPAILLYLPV